MKALFSLAQQFVQAVYGMGRLLPPRHGRASVREEVATVAAKTVIPRTIDVTIVRIGELHPHSGSENLFGTPLASRNKPSCLPCWYAYARRIPRMAVA